MIRTDIYKIAWSYGQLLITYYSTTYRPRSYVQLFDENRIKHESDGIMIVTRLRSDLYVESSFAIDTVYLHRLRPPNNVKC